MLQCSSGVEFYVKGINRFSAINLAALLFATNYNHNFTLYLFR